MKNAIKRFTNKIKADPLTRCHEYTGALNKKGYGFFSFGGKNLRAHRFAYMAFVGPIPKGLWVLHKCDNPKCCNPEHLFVGTQQDNVDDQVMKYRQMRGAVNGMAKLTEAKVRAIKWWHNWGNLSAAELGRAYGVHKSSIKDIKHGRTWSHVGA